MEIQLQGKRALVTGGSKGIGREIARLLASCGAQVVATGRDHDDLRSLQREIGAEICVADLQDPSEVRRVGEEAGEVDLLVNNAGISIPQSFLETTCEAWDQTLAVNGRAVLLLSQMVARGLIERGHQGAIVNLSSQASFVGLADHAAYCASKGALDQLTRVMALELGRFGIRVNAVNPTVTLTPMGEMAWSDPAKSGPMLARIPLGRFAKPLDVAQAVVWLLCDQSAMVHGATLPVDGGFSAT